MDTLVAQYSRPAFEDEGYSQTDQHQLTQITPSLSLNFALPQLANVSALENNLEPLRLQRGSLLTVRQ